MKTLAVVAMLMLATGPALAQKKDCNELKSEIEAKIKANGVKAFTLEVVPSADVKDGKVVGSCDSGTKKIVYKRG